ncbi:MAG: PilW family protein [Ramlibacter sp.]|nr:PilW family protein [Ramlibacter sp.]
MKTPSRFQQGFTLVELMISMVLGLFIILALLTMLVNTSRTNTEMSTVNRVIENGRFAVQLLATDISHSGYWGGHVPEFDSLIASTTAAPADVPTAVPDPCLAFSSWDPAVTPNHKNNLVGIAVQGTDVPSPVPSPTSPFCASAITNPQPSTDVLVVRHLEPCLVGSGTDDCADTRTAASPHLYFQPSRCSTDTSAFILNTSTFTLKAGDCAADAPIRRFASSIYYVRNYANAVGDGIPTLVRARFGVSNTAAAGNDPAFLPAQALVEGVEGFRVEYGIDDRSDTGATVDLAALGTAINWLTTAILNTPVNRGDGLPDRYVRCTQGAACTADQMVNVTTVKLYVLVRGEKASTAHTDTKKYCLASTCTVPADYMGPFNDSYKRHLFTQTIRLTNVATRRETAS